VANPIPYNVTVGYDVVREKDRNPTQYPKKELAYFGKGGKRKKATEGEMNEEREVRRIGEPKLCHKVNTDNRGINDPCGQVLMKWV
jgi:hypothetical protein